MLEKMNASLVAAAKMQLSADEMRVTELIEAVSSSAYLPCSHFMLHRIHA